jgi:uncharacterized damage-inducible protein DinB
MQTMEQILDELRRSLHGPAWHGPALLEALEDVSAAEALARPIAGAHTIAELAAHCLAWTEEVARRVSGADAALPERGDWPHLADLDAAGWGALRDELARAGGRLIDSLAAFPPERLRERVGGPAHDPPLGSGIRFDVMLHGLAQHNAYHGGQVVLLRRAIGGGGGGSVP